MKIEWERFHTTLIARTEHVMSDIFQLPDGRWIAVTNAFGDSEEEAKVFAENVILSWEKRHEEKKQT